MFKKPRINAFLIHLAISLVILLVPTYLIIFHWYPLPYFFTDGGLRGIIITASIFFVLGPLPTLIVYKPGKPGLKLDLTLIGLMQAAALGWGIWTTYTERPVALVYTINYFTPVSAKLLSNAELSLDKIGAKGNKKPVPVYVDIPKDRDQQQKYLISALKSGTPLYLFTNLYKEIDIERLQTLKQNSEQLYKYLESDKKGTRLLDNFYQVHPEIYNRYLFIPLHSRYKRLVIVLNASDLSYEGKLDINVNDFLLGKKNKSSGSLKD